MQKKVFVRIALFFAFAQAAIGPLASRASAAPMTSGRGQIQLVISVDWEGAHLESDNLEAMREFRRQFPQVPLLQFLNAAYFTKPGANAAGIRSAIQSVLLSTDELGLHIHGWNSLFTEAGVKYRSTPRFWGTPGECEYDCGHEVAISAYTTDELRRVIRYSVNTLEQNGLGHARSFRAGGWVANGSVLEALAAEGFRLDSSAVPAPLLYGQLKGTPLYDFILQLWSQVTSTTQPWTIRTAQGSLLELPDSGGLADYVTAEKMKELFDGAVQSLARNPDQDVYLQFGFHEETAERYLTQLKMGLRAILAKASANGIPVQFAKLPLFR
jgi:hypothetical protein